jgi:putative ABC transport system substrate-binding protein
MRRRQFIAGLGSAAAWPAVGRAQQPALPVIGYLRGGNEDGIPRLAAAFGRGLSEQGYVEGRNVEILDRWSGTRNDRLPALAADLARRQVAVIFATGGTELAAKAATATIPIVFSGGSDPVQLGLVKSLARPNGNVTGVTFLSEQLTAKRLEALHQIVPAAMSIGYLVNPTNPAADIGTKEAETASRRLGLHLAILNAASPSEIEAVFGTLIGRRIGAVLVANDPLFFVQLDLLAGLAARHKVPTIHYLREFVDTGGLMSYGPSVSDAHRIAGTYVGRILKGEKPADLPVQQSTRIEMVVNLKTAKTLGLTIPETLLATADEVIQ